MGSTQITAGQISNLDFKQAVKVLENNNISLASGAPSTVDGVTLIVNDRILVVGQSDARQNGLYDVTVVGTGSNGTWVRTRDGNTTGEINAGMIVTVTEGTTYADTIWMLTTNDPIVIDSTALNFREIIANGIYGNSNVASYLTTYTGNIAAGNISTTGNIYVGSNIVTNSISPLSSGNIYHSGNLLPASAVYNLGLPTVPWQNAYFGSNSITILDTVTGNLANAVTIENNAGNISMGAADFIIGALGNNTPVFTVQALTGQIYSNANTVINNNTNAANSTSGSLRTAGGAGIAKDLYVGGKISVAGDVYSGGTVYTSTVTNQIANGNITVNTTGTGIVNVNTNGFKVYTTTNPNPVFAVADSGDVQILAPTFNANVGALAVVGSSSGNAVPPQLSGVMLHITGQPASPSRLYIDGANGYSAVIGRRYNGNSDTPTQVLANTIVSRYGATPYGNAGWPAISTARIDMNTTENQTTTNQGTEIQFWVTPQGSNVINRVFSIANTYVTFQDGSIQSTAGIPLTQRGNANGVATLDSSGTLTVSQIPPSLSGAVIFKGTYNAANNTPTLVNGIGTAGWEYIVNVAGTQNFGAGNVTMAVGDFVIYTGTQWVDIPGAAGTVSSFNTRTGAVVLLSTDVVTAQGYTSYNGNTNPNGYVNSSAAANAAPIQSFNTRTGAITLLSSDVTTALTSGSLVNAKLANSNIIIGNTVANLGDTITTIAGLTSLTAASVVGGVMTGSSVSVAGNITGGNVYTSGLVSVVGNVYANNVSVTGTLTYASLTGTTISSAGNITGGNLRTGGTISAAGNVYIAGNLSVAGNINIVPGSYGQFANVANITATAANTAYPILFSTALANSGVNLGTGTSNSRVIISKADTYRVQYDLGVTSNSAGTPSGYFWLRKNGVDVPYSQISVNLSNDRQITQLNGDMILTLAVNDYVELYWAVSATSMLLVYTGAQTTPFAMPASPSAIITVTPVGV